MRSCVFVVTRDGLAVRGLIMRTTASGCTKSTHTAVKRAESCLALGIWIMCKLHFSLDHWSLLSIHEYAKTRQWPIHSLTHSLTCSIHRLDVNFIRIFTLNKIDLINYANPRWQIGLMSGSWVRVLPRTDFFFRTGNYSLFFVCIHQKLLHLISKNACWLTGAFDLFITIVYTVFSAWQDAYYRNID